MMFVNECSIIDSGESIGLVHVTPQGLTLPNIPKILSLVETLNIKGHKIVIFESGSKITIRISPNDMTKNRLLRPLRQKLSSLNLDLLPVV